VSTTKVDSKRDGDQCNSDLELALFGDHREEGRRRNLFSKVAASLFPSHRLLGLRAVWRELCSLRSRIAILRRNNWFRFGICLESPSQQASGRCDPQRDFRCARIRGIQKMRSIHPGATPLDFYILARTIDRDLFEEDRGKATESPSNTYDSAYSGPHRRTSL
jgi:hypothetical protein